MAATATFKQQCPSCEAMISIKEGMVGKKVECTKCKDKFIAERPEEEEEEEKASAKKDTVTAGKNTTKTAVSSKSSAPGKRPQMEADDDEEDEKPQAKAGKNHGTANGKSNGKPPQKSRRDEDEDEDEEDEDDGDGKKKKKKAGANSNKLVIGLGLAIVGVIILVAAAFFVMKGGSSSTKQVAQGGKAGGDADPKKDGDKPPDLTKKPEDNNPEVAGPLTEAGLARLSNLLPNDTEHVFHVFVKDLFQANSPVRQAVFETPGALDDLALKAKLGFSLLALDDVLVAEKYTSPGWRYTVLHFKDPIKEDDLKAALNLETLKIEGQPCYKMTKTHPWFDQLARLSFGVPNYLRFFDGRSRDKPSFIRVHDSHTLIIGDEPPVKAFLQAKGQFPLLTIRQAPVNPNPGGMGGNPSGMMGGTPNPGMMGGAPPNPGMMGGAPPRPGMMGGAPPTPGMMGGAPPSPGMMGGAPPTPGMMGGAPPTPGMMGGNPNPGMMGGTSNTGMMGGNPTPNPNPNPKANPDPVGGRDDMYLTIKPTLKAILDRMEQRGSEGKDKPIFSSVTDMDANRVEVSDPAYKDMVVRRPRQFWDVSILLYERKPRIRLLGAALIQKETLRYQYRNEINCAREVDAKEFQAELTDRTAFQIAKFIKNLTKHEVRAPSAEKTDPPVGAEDKADEKKTQEVTSSQITVNQQSSTVEFVLDLLLDFPALSHLQGISTLTASVIRVEMEAAASPSLRHALGGGVRLLGEKGLTDRGIAPGRFAPGAFKRELAKGAPDLHTDREPGKRISWMAGLLPHMGHENLFKRIQFNQSWRDPGNWMAGNTIVPQFLDPSYPDVTRQLAYGDLPLDFAATHYVGIAGVGSDAAYYKRGDPATEHKRGVLSYDGSASLDEIRQGRGLSNTAFMIQVPHDGENRIGVSPWIAGGGATLRGIPETNSIAPFVLSTDRNNNAIVHSKDGKTKQRGTYVLMTDGSVRFVDQTISDDVFKAMCTINGPAPKDFDLKLNPKVLLVPAPAGDKTKEQPKKQPPAEKPPVEKPVQQEPAKIPVVVAPPDDAKLLQGVWVGTYLEIDSKIGVPQQVQGIRYTFKGNKFLGRISADREDEHTFQVDAAKSPKHASWTKTTGNESPALAIYDLKSNNELWICVRPSDSKLGRPTAFATQPGSDSILLKFKRQTP